MKIDVRLVTSLLLLIPIASFPINSLKRQSPNVLFIVVDDLNDWISLLNKENPIKMPNLEKLDIEGYCLQMLIVHRQIGRAHV